jgi:hypothetical protein
MRFSASKPPIFAQNGTRKSPLIMFWRQELIIPPVAGAVASKTTYILTYSGFTKQTQFSPDIKEVRWTGRTGVQRSARGKGGQLSTAEVSAAVDRGRLFQAYSKGHPRAQLSAARFLKPEPHIGARIAIVAQMFAEGGRDGHSSDGR